MLDWLTGYCPHMHSWPTFLFTANFFATLASTAMILWVSAKAMVGRGSRDWLFPRGTADPLVDMREDLFFNLSLTWASHYALFWDKSSPSQLFADITKFKFDFDSTPYICTSHTQILTTPRRAKWRHFVCQFGALSSRILQIWIKLGEDLCVSTRTKTVNSHCMRVQSTYSKGGISQI